MSNTPSALLIFSILFGFTPGFQGCQSTENPVNSIDDQRQVLFYDGFESDSLQWFIQTARESNVQHDRSVSARVGQQCLHVEVFKSDPWIQNGPRSEIFRPTGIDYWLEGDEVWIGGSVYFPDDYVDDPMQEIIWQIHDEETGVPFLIQSVEGNLVIKGMGINSVTLPKKKGQWMDIVTHHKWSSAATGITQVFIDGQLKVDANQIVTMSAGRSLYAKFGLYKSGWKFEGDSLSTTTYREIWLDEIRIGDAGSSYADVAP